MTNQQQPPLAYSYGRVSTDGQDSKLSTSVQHERVQEKALTLGFKIAREWSEVGSAATVNREVFQEMLALLLSPAHPVKILIANDLSRLFRDDEDFYVTRRFLREAGVELYTVKEGHLSVDTQSQLVFGINSMLNSQVPRDTAILTRNGQFGATNRGFYIGPDVFGYEKYPVWDKDDEHTGLKKQPPKKHQKLRPHPTQWEHLLTMFRMGLEDHGGQRVADHLNDLGVKTNKGKEWTEGGVLYVWRNPVYRGQTHRGKRSKSPHLPHTEQAGQENAHPAAVTEEEYQEIEELIRLRTTAPGGPRGHSSPNPLSGHVKCGVCGWDMTLSTSKGITRLICSNKRHNKIRACRGKNVRLDILVPRVVAALLDRILTEQNLRQQVNMVAETNREFLEEQQSARKTLEKNIKGTEKIISNLVDGIEESGGSAQVYVRLDQRESELKQLTIQLESLDETYQDQMQFLNNPERIVACALDLRTYIESEDPEIAKTFILSFIKKIVVLENQATIHYTVPVPQNAKGEPKPTDTVSLKKNAGLKESCLLPPRVGMDQALTHVAGCICFIVQSTQNAPHPSHLVAMSGSQQDRFLKDLPHGHPAGSGQDDMLRSVLEYHGASAIVGVSPRLLQERQPSDSWHDRHQQ